MKMIGLAALLALAFMFVSAVARAQATAPPTDWTAGLTQGRWLWIGGAKSTAAYMRVAVPSVSPEGYRRRWSRYEYEFPQHGYVLQVGYLSTVALEEYDCARGRQRALQFTAYSDRNGSGDEVPEPPVSKEWSYPIPSTFGDILQTRVCGK